ncbi:UPF0016 family protein [Aneurinibacillus sp. Ricciae_BoGa-3]|uniref:UPF0016 family protein n=1 Tax=Aneurinibacillus sp. Ricciae_BoGa-3 TaxID=3022697 RepID=UPI0023401D4D|nr:UPF0016 family protein [Aneurinibacillus sp. Ricciae_BoGa-3]WCK55291.1 UPF0016 family protein [Aneurinibacillus sp. Ricciae_BoGa-3]
MRHLLSTALKSEIGVKTFAGALSGYMLALFTSPVFPHFVSMAIPPAFAFTGFAWGYKKIHRARQRAKTVQEFIQGDEVLFVPAPASGSYIGMQREVKPVSEYAQQVMLALAKIRERVMTENGAQKLDNEIASRTLAIISRIQTLIPYVEDTNSIELNHLVKRLATSDLGSIIQPFLRLSEENKIKSRRLILDSLRSIDDKLNEIFGTIEQHDLLELDRKATLISHRYNPVDK